jgi:hypothetical protein
VQFRLRVGVLADVEAERRGELRVLLEGLREEVVQ